MSIVHISELKADPANARIHTERNISMIADGIQEVGMGRSILIDATGEVIAGNGVLEAAAQAGVTKVRIVDTEGDEVIAVRRADLTGRRKIRAALLDNRAQEVGGGWNVDVLRDFAFKDEKILDGYWGKTEIDYLLSQTPLTDDIEPTWQEAGPTSPQTEASNSQRMVLWVPKDQYDDFLTQLRLLSARWGIDDIPSVVIRAVAQAVQETAHE